MNELDLIKQYWKRDAHFPRVEQKALRGMIYRSSSSIVKWIFLISVIEFLLGILLNAWYFFSDTPSLNDNQPPMVMEWISGVVDVLIYLCIIYFMYRFFTSYKKIRNTNNTKELLQDILEARRNVHRYIKLNIYIIVYSAAMVGINKLLEKNLSTSSTGEIIMQVTLVAVVSFLVGWLCIRLIKLYYRLIYLRLVKKLDRNYEELIRLETEEENQAPH